MSSENLLLDLSHATAELFAAWAAAQGEIQNADKNAENKHLGRNYADLGEVLTEIRAVFPKNGLALIQSPSFDGLNVTVVSVVSHSSGAYITSTLSGEIPMKSIQGVGAAITYLRRYAASALAGISQEDADGEDMAAMKLEGGQQRGQQRQQGQGQQQGQPRARAQDQQQDDPPAEHHGAGTGHADEAPDQQHGVIFDADLSTGQVGLLRAKAKAAGMDDAGLYRRFGTITPDNLNQTLVSLREAAAQ